MKTIKIRNMVEYSLLWRSCSRERILAEKAISQIIRKRESGYIFGWCQVCNRPSKFLLDWKYSYSSTPNFRERLVCESCGLNNRQRYTYYYLRSLVSKKQYPNVLMFEQVTNFYKLRLLHNSKKQT